MDALERDRSLIRLRGLVANHFAHASVAVARLSAQVDARSQEAVERKRKHAAETRILAEVAKESYLDPERMDATAFVVQQGSEPLDGYFEVIAGPGREIKQWMVRARELGSYIDISTGREIGNLRGFIELAAERGFDVKSKSGVEAYIFARTLPHERGQLSREEVLPEIDPDAVVAVALPQPFMLYNRFEKELWRDPSDARHDHEWWELAMLFLWMHVPDHDWSVYPGSRSYPWRASKDHPDYGWSRIQYREVMAKHEASRLPAHDLLLQRTVEQVTYLGTMPSATIATAGSTIADDDEQGDAPVDGDETSTADAPNIAADPATNAGDEPVRIAPDLSRVRLSLSQIAQTDDERHYTVDDVARLYGLDPATFRNRRTSYVQRKGRPFKKHLLPANSEQNRDGGQFAENTWSRDEVVIALRGWEQRLDPGSASGLG